MRLTKIFSLTLLCVVLAGCAGKPEVQSDYDHAVDFSQYQTFNFVKPAKGYYLTLQQKYIQDAITQQMTQRGYKKSENPDLLIYAHPAQEGEKEVAFTPAFVGWGGAWDWQTYDQSVSDWTKNSLNIDVVDPHKKQQVWRGTISQVSPGEAKEVSELDIQRAVAGVFKSYPVKP
ncbi:DUF4136 domain-containing protein [Citrobacter sp. R56]|uniref:DUF4136 domain-containing protein n=1 Tax=Citrobacter sp. R56 TaxID=1573676 RepID=UPI00193BA4D3|nr:DUF4136 domain-containing protein [Citrobacter sp. R56]QRG77211.1 DUF4136 domain-containing protein [Citrobacter sp. R56]